MAGEVLDIGMGPGNDVQPMAIIAKRANQELSLRGIRPDPRARGGHGNMPYTRLPLPNPTFFVRNCNIQPSSLADIAPMLTR